MFAMQVPPEEEEEKEGKKQLDMHGNILNMQVAVQHASPARKGFAMEVPLGDSDSDEEEEMIEQPTDHEAETDQDTNGEAHHDDIKEVSYEDDEEGKNIHDEADEQQQIEMQDELGMDDYDRYHADVDDMDEQELDPHEQFQEKFLKINRYAPYMTDEGDEEGGEELFPDDVKMMHFDMQTDDPLRVVQEDNIEAMERKRREENEEEEAAGAAAADGKAAPAAAAAADPLPYWPPPPHKPACYRGFEREPHILNKREQRAAGMMGMMDDDAVPQQQQQQQQQQKFLSQPNQPICFSSQFRVGWGPNGTLLLPGSTIGSLRKSKLKVHADSRYSRGLLLQHQLSCKKEAEEKGKAGDRKSGRRSRALPAIQLCQDYAAVGAKGAAGSSGLKNSNVVRMGRSVWDLISQLWTRGGAGESEALAAMGAWLQQTIQDEIQEEIEESKRGGASFERKIYSNLTGHMLHRAMKCARDAQYWRLSVLVTRAGLCHEDVAAQLQSWDDSTKISISGDLRKIFHLLSGDVSVHCQDVSWMRALGIHLWYANAAWPSDQGAAAASGSLVPREEKAIRAVVGKQWEKTLKSVVQSYENHSNDNGRHPAVAPYPPHAAAAVDGKGRTVRVGQRGQDLRFSILKLYCEREAFEGGLSRLLLPEKAFKSLLDHTVSWHLYEVLRRSGTGLEQLCLPSADGRVEAFGRAGVLISNYAAQLEAQGEWRWAVYVLMHARRDPLLGKLIDAEYIVRDILTRHCVPAAAAAASSSSYAGGGGDWRGGAFLDSCGVSASWVAEAMAWRALSFHHHQAAYNCFLQAGPGFLKQAYRLLMRMHALSSFAEGKAVAQLKAIAVAERKGAFQEWTVGGKLILEYLSNNNSSSSSFGAAEQRRRKAWKSVRERVERCEKILGNHASDELASRCLRSEVSSFAIDDVERNLEEDKKTDRSPYEEGKEDHMRVITSKLPDILEHVNESARLDHLDAMSNAHLSAMKFRSR